MEKKTYKTICISDVHLGTKDCQADLLDDFLKNNTCEKLYLVGDIVDAWKIQQNKFKWKSSHTDVVRRILKISKQHCQVIYIAGNHDEFLRPIIPIGFSFGNITVCNQAEHIGVNGKRYLLVHGDLFDGITRLAPWLAFLGDKAYDIVLGFNTAYNRWRHRFGLGYWSLSKYLKQKVKKAVDFMFQFEKNLAAHCKKKGFDGVICGHIHNAEIKVIDGIEYMNDGDWVESCTALVEHYNGKWEIVHWTRENKDVDPSSDSSTHKQPKRHTRKSNARIYDATTMPTDIGNP